MNCTDRQQTDSCSFHTDQCCQYIEYQSNSDMNNGV